MFCSAISCQNLRTTHGFSLLFVTLPGMLLDNGGQFLWMNAERFQMAKHASDIWAVFAAKYFPSGFPPDIAMKGATHTTLSQILPSLWLQWEFYLSKAPVGACQLTSPFIMFLMELRAAVFISSLANTIPESNGALCLPAHHSGGGPQLILACTLCRCKKITCLPPSSAGNRGFT